MIFRTPLFGFLASLALATSVAAGCGGGSSSPAGPAGGDDSGATGDDAGVTTGDGAVPGTDGAMPNKDGSTPMGDAGPPPQFTTAVSIIVEPGDNGQGLISAIQNARTSVHMTMYLLSNNAVINALIAQKTAGHEVKVILNKTFPSNGGSNAGVYSQLQSAGVNVVWSPPGFTYTHEKTVIIDGATAWIMTMNATQSSPSSNREYLAVDTDPSDVAEAEAIFQGDFANTSTAANGKLVVAPDNARTKLVALIGSAAHTVDMEAEELSDYMIVGAMTAAADRGVRVRVVIAAGTGTPTQTAAIATLKMHGVSLVSLNSPYIHAKSCVVDGAAAYVGSENFSGGSLGYNRELGVLFNVPAEVGKVLTATTGDFSHGTAL